MGASPVATPSRGDRAPALLLSVLSPPAVNTYLFAERYQAAPRVAVRTVLWTSVFAVLTVSALLILLGT
ncbi:MAG: hypothetical protein WEA34_13220 [Gemmatimonadota bacterium]